MVSTFLNWRLQPPDPLSFRRSAVTSVGNIRRVKGYDILVKAAASIVAATFPVFHSISQATYWSQTTLLNCKTLIRDSILPIVFSFAGGVTDLKHLCLGGYLRPTLSQ